MCQLRDLRLDGDLTAKMAFLMVRTGIFGDGGIVSGSLPEKLSRWPARGDRYE